MASSQRKRGRCGRFGTFAAFARHSLLLTVVSSGFLRVAICAADRQQPNIILIFSDDKCYASGRIVTKPNVSCDKHCISPCLQITENSRKFSSIQGQ